MVIQATVADTEEEGGGHRLVNSTQGAQRTKVKGGDERVLTAGLDRAGSGAGCFKRSCPGWRGHVVPSARHAIPQHHQLQCLSRPGHFSLFILTPCFPLHPCTIRDDPIDHPRFTAAARA